MKNYKIYGDEKTSLTLSDKAREGYSDSSYTIVEREDENVSYAIYDDRNLGSRHLVRDNMTAAEVDEFFCEMEDDTTIYMLKQDILDEIDSNLTPEEAEAAGYLTVNTARNGRDTVWYYDGINQVAYYIDNNDKLTDDEIEEQLM